MSENVTVQKKIFVVSNHVAPQSGPVKSRYLIYRSRVLPNVSVAQADVWVSFAMCIQFNFLDLKDFMVAIYIRGIKVRFSASLLVNIYSQVDFFQAWLLRLGVVLPSFCLLAVAATTTFSGFCYFLFPSCS